jgi:hypothetical protein
MAKRVLMQEADVVADLLVESLKAAKEIAVASGEFVATTPQGLVASFELVATAVLARYNTEIDRLSKICTTMPEMPGMPEPGDPDDSWRFGLVDPDDEDDEA